MPITYPLSYTTVDNIYKLVVGISSVTNLTSADTSYLVGKAQAEINQALSKLYSLPFTVEIPILQSITEDIGIYYILRRFYTDQMPSKTEWTERFEEKKKLLDKIISGEEILMNSSGSVIQPSMADLKPKSTTQDYAPTMGFRDSIYSNVDEDRLDAEDDLAG